MDIVYIKVCTFFYVKIPLKQRLTTSQCGRVPSSRTCCPCCLSSSAAMGRTTGGSGVILGPASDLSKGCPMENASQRPLFLIAETLHLLTVPSIGRMQRRWRFPDTKDGNYVRLANGGSPKLYSDAQRGTDTSVASGKKLCYLHCHTALGFRIDTHLTAVLCLTDVTWVMHL